MSQYDNNMSGALFKNAKKVTDKQPDYNGQCEINNEVYYIGAWLKTSKEGKTYMSLAFTPKDAVQNTQPVQTADVSVDSEIPF